MALVVQVDPLWQLVGTMPDGTDVQMVAVYTDTRVVGRIYDLGEEFIAEYVDMEGEVDKLPMGDYAEALEFITQAALERHRTLH